MGITKSEREELVKLVKMRARVAKMGVDQRRIELLADFENKMATRYQSDDAAWADITQETQEAVQRADEAIAQRCRELGIPEQFRPSVHFSRYGRGENAVKERRAELRKVAERQLEAEAKRAKVHIEKKTVDMLTALTAGALESAEAKEFLLQIPNPEQLLPPLELPELEGQLPNPNP